MSSNQPNNNTTTTDDEQLEAQQEQKEMKEIENQLSKQQVSEKVYESICTLDHSFGFESMKRNNIHYLKDNIILTSVGNTMQFIDIVELRYRWLDVPGHGGIGAIALHPSKKYIAVGEKSREKPNVYIYEITIAESDIDSISLKPYKTLRNGTLKAFSSLAFNSKGNRLATVGSSPDFLLTIWNWEQEKIALRYKAFGQDVFSVSFSATSEGQLTTSGTGHIKFWKMAKTFTGLKLKGQIGKFGKIDISDISSCVELPDGKVLSGCEDGYLLLWDENLIKCLLTSMGEKCHQNGIEVVIYDEKESVFITGGNDGYIRFWDFNMIDTAEPVDSNNIISIRPKRQIFIGEDVKVRAIIRENDIWIVQDSNGGFWKYPYLELDAQAEKIFSFHSGAIGGILTSPTDHVAITGGEDGTLRCFDYFWSKKELYSIKFKSGVSKMMWNPVFLDQTGTVFTSGFLDGSVRVLKRCEDSFALTSVFKPHKSKVNDFAYSKEDNLFVSCGDDNTVFFFDYTQNFSPIGYAKFQQPIKSVMFTSDNKELILFALDGTIMRMEKPDPTKIDTLKTFEFTPITKKVNYSQFMKKEAPPKKVKSEEDSDDEDSDEEDVIEEIVEEKPGDIAWAMLSKDDKLIISFERGEGLVEYDSKLLLGPSNSTTDDIIYPKCCLTNYNSVCTSLTYSANDKFLVCGFRDGFVLFIESDTKKEFRGEFLHDCIFGEITGAITSFDCSYLLSVGREGCFFSQRIPLYETKQGEKPNLTFISEEVTVEDLSPNQAVSIEEAREQEELFKKQAAAEKRKEEKKKKIHAIKAKFLEIAKENEKREADIKLSREELQVDTTLKERVLESNKKKLEETKQEMDWNSAKHDVALKKLKDHFIDCLDVERIDLKAFRSGTSVASFKTRKLEVELKKEIEKVHNLINEEIGRKRALKNNGDDIISAVEIKENNTPSTHSSNNRRRKTVLNNFEKQEQLKREKEERERQRHALLSRKPSETEEDPEEISEILRAQQNMGDYKLKSAHDYIVPDGQRVTPEKKIRQIILLQESMHTLRMVFNVRLLGLRDLKIRLIEKFKHYNEKINEINHKIGVNEKLYEPELLDEEYPEKRENISVSEMDDQEKTDDKSHNKKGGTKNAPKQHKENEDTITSKLSELEKAEKESELQKLVYEKKRYLRKQDKQVESFDNAIEDLRREKFKLDGDLKSADLKLLVLYRELKILREYEVKDLKKIQDLLSKKQEKAAIQSQIADCQEQLQQKKKEVQQIKKQKYLIQEFHTLVPQNHPTYGDLWKLFTGSDRDDDDENLSDAGSTDGEKYKIPSGCTEDLYHQILDLKNRRIEQEKALNSIDKAAKSIKTKREGFQKVEANIIKDLNKIEESIRETQKEKQNKLNELETIVVLKFNQIQSLVQNKIAADLSDQIVFTNKSLQALFDRIRELSREKDQLRTKYIELQRTQRGMLKEQKSLEEKFSGEQEKVREVQMLKFGKEINLEEMENAKIDIEAEEIKAELLLREQESARILKEWDKKITEYKQTMIKINTENTQLLSRISGLKAQQKDLEGELDTAQNTVIQRMERAITTTKDNTSLYKNVINEQNKKIDSVKNDIAMLTFKASSLGY